LIADLTALEQICKGLAALDASVCEDRSAAPSARSQELKADLAEIGYGKA
jgi:hypothetical protein